MEILKQKQIDVYEFIKSFIENQGDVTFPTYNEIVDGLGLKKCTVQCRIRKLKEQGYIKKFGNGKNSLVLIDDKTRKPIIKKDIELGKKDLFKKIIESSKKELVFISKQQKKLIPNELKDLLIYIEHFILAKKESPSYFYIMEWFSITYEVVQEMIKSLKKKNLIRIKEKGLIKIEVLKNTGIIDNNLINVLRGLK